MAYMTFVDTNALSFVIDVFFNSLSPSDAYMRQ